MISKIVDIEGKKFGENAPDYMYKKYLKLPFDFTIQAISGTDLNEVRRVFKELQRQLPPALSSDFVNIPCTLDLNEVKLDKFKDDVYLQNIYGHSDSQLTIFVEFPETMLTIDQQRSFVKDYLTILKENLDVKKTKNVLMFIATNSPIILTDVLDENVLFFNKPSDRVDEYISKNKTFCGHILDILSKFSISGFAAETAIVMVQKIFNDVRNKKKVSDEIIDAVGDEYLNRTLKREKQIYEKRKDFGE